MWMKTGKYSHGHWTWYGWCIKLSKSRGTGTFYLYGVKCLLVIKAINRLGAHLRLKSGIPRAIMVTLAGVIRAELCRGPPLNISLTGTMPRQPGIVCGDPSLQMTRLSLIEQVKSGYLIQLEDVGSLVLQMRWHSSFLHENKTFTQIKQPSTIYSTIYCTQKSEHKIGSYQLLNSASVFCGQPSVTV